MERLQKFMAAAGVASRRASEELIRAGRVAVNGQVVRLLGTRVDPARDAVAVDGQPLKLRRKLYVAVNKPRGYVCTRRDPEQRRIVLDLLPREWSHLHPVGRLDYDSEGLLLLTNDGEFSNRLTHPRYGVLKTYMVVLDGRVPDEVVRAACRGIFHEGERLKAHSARVLKVTPSHSIVEVQLGEGRNREVRRLFEAQGFRVSRLERVQIGRLRLGELPAGKWRTLTASEIESLLKHHETTSPSD